MKTIRNITILGLLAAFSALAQYNTLTATTLSAAVTSSARQITVASATGISAPVGNTSVGTQLYVVDPGRSQGEVMTVTAVNSTTISVSRVNNQTTGHISGSMVLAGAPNLFYKYDPVGNCTASTTLVTPWVNTVTGAQWVCGVGGQWIRGWGTPGQSEVGVAPQASVAGAQPINFRYFHVSGTNAITSFTMGVGWHGQDFCLYPDGAFTGTATNNIAKAFTAVADRTICFYWDAANSKFSPSY